MFRRPIILAAAALVLLGSALSAQAEDGARPFGEAGGPAAISASALAPERTLRPQARLAFLPRARWDHRDEGALWTRAAMSAVARGEAPLVRIVPRDIEDWCPAYPDNPPALRRAFWVGMMSALAKHESTWNPRAVGGDGRWFGLLQISPDTARRYGCGARTGEALRRPVGNLSCAARIMAVTVARDGAVALNDGRWRGVAADWGPMRQAGKLQEMTGWLRRQSYCRPPESLRPRARPAFTAAAGAAASPRSN